MACPTIDYNDVIAEALGDEEVVFTEAEMEDIRLASEYNERSRADARAELIARGIDPDVKRW